MTKLPGRVSGFSPLPCPGTPAASPQRRLPCHDELLTGPNTACLMLCQARHGAAGMLAASWPTPCITGLNPFYPPLSLSLALSVHPFFLSSASGLLCKAFKAEMWEFFWSTDPNHICTISCHVVSGLLSVAEAARCEAVASPLKLTMRLTIWNQTVTLALCRK